MCKYMTYIPEISRNVVYLYIYVRTPLEISREISAQNLPADYAVSDNYLNHLSINEMKLIGNARVI